MKCLNTCTIGENFTSKALTNGFIQSILRQICPWDEPGSSCQHYSLCHSMAFPSFPQVLVFRGLSVPGSICPHPHLLPVGRLTLRPSEPCVRRQSMMQVFYNDGSCLDISLFLIFFLQMGLQCTANSVRLSVEYTSCQGNAMVQEMQALMSQKRACDSGDTHAGQKDCLSAQLQRLGHCSVLPSIHLELLHLTYFCKLPAMLQCTMGKVLGVYLTLFP